MYDEKGLMIVGGDHQHMKQIKHLRKANIRQVLDELVCFMLDDPRLIQFYWLILTSIGTATHAYTALTTILANILHTPCSHPP